MADQPPTATQWLAQLAAMKAAVAALPPPPSPPHSTTSDWSNDDIDIAFEPRTSPRDIWDFISDDELEALDFDDDSGDGVDRPGPSSGSGYDADWLATRCAEISSRRSGALDPGALQAQILEILAASSGGEEQRQSALTDLVGFDDLDFVIELLSHRDEVVQHATAAGGGGREIGPGVRLLSKAQREAALKQQDRQHKFAPLAKAEGKEEEYPHVYRAFAAGNTLSASGKRFALPVGSTREEFERYEEYSIPAGKTGVLGVGRRLVEIDEMDGLCRRTFRGYKALNRMQSLVYPVAYKTSENMLICAPTGAVSCCWRGGLVEGSR